MQDYAQDTDYPTGVTFGSRRSEATGPEDFDSEGTSSLGAQVRDLSPHELGALGEDLAVAYLQSKGYQIIDRNWTCPYGEADIVAHDGTVCVLVEVKSRMAKDATEPLWPELAVTADKRKRYARIAECYLRYADIGLLRFDVIAVSVVADGTAHVHHIESAFGCDA